MSYNLYDLFKSFDSLDQTIGDTKLLIENLQKDKTELLEALKEVFETINIMDTDPVLYRKVEETIKKATT